MEVIGCVEINVLVTGKLEVRVVVEYTVSMGIVSVERASVEVTGPIVVYRGAAVLVTV